MSAAKHKPEEIVVEKKWIERAAENATKWLGSTSSLIFHTILFIISASLPFFGVPFESVLLVVTTAVSLEAIYMNIFIQMAVNKNTADIEEIQEDVDEIQEDIEEIGEDVDEIQKDVDEIQEDVEGIEKDVDEIQKDVDEIQEDIEEIEEADDKEAEEEKTQQQKEFDALASIQSILTNLQKEIEQLKK
jgi:septal ring factor EnvC (AmiA/AmiB activator)